ncbi:MAG: transposase [Deltaproteobacteria bacterium]|nr:transposase [Deltaproteobacteria bacterium]
MNDSSTAGSWNAGSSFFSATDASVSMLWPFSCKGRAICPSCGARRMQETAAHLVDGVLPDVALRQYVLSPPFELRGLLACKRQVLAKMVSFFVRAIFEQLTGWARCQDLPEPKCGAVTFIQRFTKTLNISPHLHVLVLDGVFANEEEGPRFVECPAPTNRDLLSLAQSVFKKMEKFLAKSGYLRSESDALEEASLTPLERWYVRGLAEPSMLSPSRIVDVKSTASKLCLYAARPPFAEGQLRMTDDGRVRLTLRRPAKNGQGAIVLSPVQFLRRLAWLVPPPAQHQVRYAGVLASASKVRRAIVPRPAPVLQLAFPIENMRPRVQKHRMSWAKLLARVYSIDGERCLSCGGPT